ncbi:unnamed protein product [Moneuplotes crassus]|uniref:Uncharacterized protein n=1 Tax=Euplotes crassus TaxID=5936 RepID=A0AAD1XG67_EUPCR|nr:unnamed protein product [Moneuplotes crassus]
MNIRQTSLSPTVLVNDINYLLKKNARSVKRDAYREDVEVFSIPTSPRFTSQMHKTFTAFQSSNHPETRNKAKIGIFRLKKSLKPLTPITLNTNFEPETQLNAQNFSEFLKVKRSKICQKPVFNRIREFSPVVVKPKKAGPVKLVVNKKRRMDHLSPDQKPQTLLNSSTEYSGMDKEYDGIYLGSQNESDSVRKIRMKPIDKQDSSSPVKHLRMESRCQLGHNKGTQVLEKRLPREYRKQVSKFSTQSNNDTFEPYKMVRRFDTDLSHLFVGQNPVPNADLL